MWWYHHGMSGKGCIPLWDVLTGSLFSVQSKQSLEEAVENCLLNTFRLRQNGRHFADDIFKCIFLNENIWIAINISLSFVPKGPIDNIPALVQIIVWRRPGDKPLSEPMMVNLLTYICVGRPQWVKCLLWLYCSQEVTFILVLSDNNKDDSAKSSWSVPQQQTAAPILLYFLNASGTELGILWLNNLLKLR